MSASRHLNTEGIGLTPAKAEQHILSTGSYRRATSPTRTVVGFALHDDRQLALTLTDSVPRVWLEPGNWLNEEIKALFPKVVPYPATRGRHANIGRNAPRLAFGHALVKVVVPTLELLVRLLAAYERDTDTSEANSQPLQTQPVAGRDLSLKDDSDVAAIASALSYTQKRIHNNLTNEVLHLLGGLKLSEGVSPGPMYDLLVKNYDNDNNDLLVEVKSSVGLPHIRMAIGQLYSYHFERGAKANEHFAILLPSQPNARTVEFLRWLDIGLLWIDDGRLITRTPWLKPIANDA